MTVEDLDIKRDSDVPILTPIDWRLASPLASGWLLSSDVS